MRPESRRAFALSSLALLASVSALPGLIRSHDGAPCPGLARERSALQQEDDAAPLVEPPRIHRTVRTETGTPTLRRAHMLYDEVKAVIAKMSSTQLRDFAAPMIRLAFHDAMTHDSRKSITYGGVDASLGNIRGHRQVAEELRAALQPCLRDYTYNPAPSAYDSSRHFPLNAEGCSDLKYGETHTMNWAGITAEEYCRDYTEISWADCWMFVASIFLEGVGGPPLQVSSFVWGRNTSELVNDTYWEGADGQSGEPAEDDGFSDLMAYFRGQLGFTSVGEIVALGGAHTVGKSRSSSTGIAGTWDTTPHIFDNQYFQRVIQANDAGVQQFKTVCANMDVGEDVADLDCGASGRGWRNYWAPSPFSQCAAQRANTGTKSSCITDDGGCNMLEQPPLTMYPEDPVNGSLILYNADLAFYWDIATGCSAPLKQVGKASTGDHALAAEWVERFAADNELFIHVFSSAWQKLIIKGNDPNYLHVATKSAAPHEANL